MAFQPLDLSNLFDDLHISELSDHACCLESISIEEGTEGSTVKSNIKSTVEADIVIDDTTHNIYATGCYSNIEIVLMYGNTKRGNKFRSHWGLICKQEECWVLNSESRKCLLFHHMGSFIEIAVGCLKCCQNRVKNAYGTNNVPNAQIKSYDFGISRAAVYRFLGDKCLKRNAAFKYNSKYAKGNQYYEWRTTNCCRLVFDILFHLKLDFEIATKFTITTTGHERWNEVVSTIVTDYPEFMCCIVKFWSHLSTTDELKKVATLIDGQYKLDDAFKVGLEVILKDENLDECSIM